ncbi:MAG: SOS response-associated peptidase [Calothrix sp. C42_A2020_038]|nr:SOS response-associated peptidase [Calothrix sp. C42_A2020_038]
MCGRFTLTSSEQGLAEVFKIQDVLDLNPRYNIAPTQSVVTVLHHPETQKRMFNLLRWGLIPSWSKDPNIATKLINARSETVAEKPSFRSAFKKRRCLIVASGFYEWQHREGKKQPFYFQLEDKQPFGFAGLWEHWLSPDGEEIDTCTILTTSANELMAPVHDRMPVILKPEDYDLWLDPQVQDPKMLQPLLQPFPTEAMTSHPVSTIVNSPRNDTPECVVPVGLA